MKIELNFKTYKFKLVIDFMNIYSRKLLLKYLGIKMYLVRLKKPPEGKVLNFRTCAEIAELALGTVNIGSF